MLAGRCINIYDQGQVRPITEADKARIRAASDAMADTALRVLALAYEENDDSADEEGITFIGLVGMIDPPREEAKTSVEAFKRASIKTVMITGDHKNTAFAIAKELGIAERMEQCITGQEIDQMSQEELNEHAQDLCVFARVSPENKVAIVKAYQSNGQIVSMTGDGVNDAPSLKAADIGVAMGITGTEVSKGAADMVLADDNFSTIEKAVEEGRTIYNNIRKSVVFLLSSNWGEIVSMFVAIVLGLAAPLRAVHILWVNLITDTLPGLALGVDAKERDVMGAPPRDSNESLFAGGKMKIIGINGLIIGLATLGAFLYVPVSALLRSGTAISLTAINTALASELVRAQTYAFVTLALSQLFYAVGMRSFETPVFKMNHKSNRLMILAFVLGIGLQVCVTTIPALNTLFSTTSLGLLEWIGLLLVSTIPLWFNELIFKTKERHRHQ
jgi:Ca2+-transporting ATPase